MAGKCKPLVLGFDAGRLTDRGVLPAVDGTLSDELASLIFDDAAMPPGAG